MAAKQLNLQILNDLEFELKEIFIDAKNSNKEVTKAKISISSKGMVVDGEVTAYKEGKQFIFEKKSLLFSDGEKEFLFVDDKGQIPYEEVPFSQESKVLCEKLYINTYIIPEWFNQVVEIINNYNYKSSSWDTDF